MSDQWKTIPGLEGEGKERGRAGKGKKGRRRRSRSGSNSSSSSSRSSSDGDRFGSTRARTGGKNKSKASAPTPGSPYKEAGVKQARKEEKAGATGEENKKSYKKPSTESDNNNNNSGDTSTIISKGDNQTRGESAKNNRQSQSKGQDSNAVKTNRKQNDNNNNNDSVPKTSSNDSRGKPQWSHSARGRPATSGARLESSGNPRGYDNSERNPYRQNLGSSTDQVADQRPIFGAWKTPDPERQRLLVERLAPAKPPVPQDPRFNHWKNHFLYYWHIGVDRKPRREGNYQNSSRVHQHCEVGKTSAYCQNGYDHRLLRRPKTTSGRVMRDHNNSNHHHMGLDLANHPYTGSASVGGRPAKQQGGSQSAREYGPGDSPSIVSGLDRRYMGLQAVSSSEMQEIVDRLTKMTSAYNAKFAPNPHVWVDTEPGAHMVKRSHTTFG
ncbi:hypothetical protein PoB_007613000 [Plakobranchus ocellatus]|uniref:Uncharacterized protein n=1 Tax=Plakobranchus ocellatus TaxID=259542 RepID=A0AAV4E051_9GAST|nr:hypothetical protein PoB_007613000 [Plakobranchus ocellatus]